MGSSSWSDSFYAARNTSRLSSGADAFAYDSSLRSSVPYSDHKVHDKMNPKGVIRESRDSDTHPDSVPLAIIFDVTGSMASVPRVLQTKLSELMALLVKKGYIGNDPQIMFGAIGDATCDRVPLQIGQFESGIEMDDDLGRIYLEGGGGGHITESYELAAYFMLNKVKTDAWEKRQRKGYLFFIGDETPYNKINKQQVSELIGDNLEADLSTSDLFEQLQERWNVFMIIPGGTNHASDDNIRNVWIKHLGQNVIRLPDAATVCESIAMAVGVCEGKIDIDEGVRDLVDVGVDSSVATAVSKAIIPIAKGTIKPVDINPNVLTETGTDSVSRL